MHGKGRSIGAKMDLPAEVMTTKQSCRILHGREADGARKAGAYLLNCSSILFFFNHRQSHI